MRAIRLGLFAVLLTTAGAPAHADTINIDALSDHRRDVRQEPTRLKSDAMFADLDLDPSSHRKADTHASAPSLKKEKSCGQGKSAHGRCSEHWHERHSVEPPRHSVPEPGTLLLMGMGMLAGGVLHLRRRR